MFSNTDAAPDMSRSDWWCPYDSFYGWLGYVRDLKGETCDDPVYSLPRLQSDFRKMSADGAKMVRIYGPICGDTSVWNNIVQAAAENNLGVLGIVWHGYDDAEIAGWRQREDSLLKVLRENPLAPYVIHSVSFGSEPLFSWSISDIYVDEFNKLKAELADMGIPITVSEMKYGYDQAPEETANAVKKGIDFISAHIMPYYGNCKDAADEWGSITSDIEAYQAMIPGKNMMITQNPWGSDHNGRDRGSNCNGDIWHDVSVEAANTYWNLWTSNCAYFKNKKIGWFAHTFNTDSEANFGIYGEYSEQDPYPHKIDFNPGTC